MINVYQIVEEKKAFLKIEENNLYIIFKINKDLLGNEEISIKLKSENLSLEYLYKFIQRNK